MKNQTCIPLWQNEAFVFLHVLLKSTILKLIRKNVGGGAGCRSRYPSIPGNEAWMPVLRYALMPNRSAMNFLKAYIQPGAVPPEAHHTDKCNKSLCNYIDLPIRLLHWALFL